MPSPDVEVPMLFFDIDEWRCDIPLVLFFGVPDAFIPPELMAPLADESPLPTTPPLLEAPGEPGLPPPSAPPPCASTATDPSVMQVTKRILENLDMVTL